MRQIAIIGLLLGMIGLRSAVADDTPRPLSIPRSYWSMRAIAELRSGGLVIGYPSVRFPSLKGAKVDAAHQSTTEWEMAFTVDRASMLIENQVNYLVNADASSLSSIKYYRYLDRPLNEVFQPDLAEFRNPRNILSR